MLNLKSWPNLPVSAVCWKTEWLFCFGQSVLLFCLSPEQNMHVRDHWGKKEVIWSNTQQLWLGWDRCRLQCGNERPELQHQQHLPLRVTDLSALIQKEHRSWSQLEQLWVWTNNSNNYFWVWKIVQSTFSNSGSYNWATTGNWFLYSSWGSGKEFFSIKQVIEYFRVVQEKKWKKGCSVEQPWRKEQCYHPKVIWRLALYKT